MDRTAPHHRLLLSGLQDEEDGLQPHRFTGMFSSSPPRFMLFFAKNLDSDRFPPKILDRTERRGVHLRRANDSSNGNAGAWGFGVANAIDHSLLLHRLLHLFLHALSAPLS